MAPGGTSSDVVTGIKVDSSGNAYVAGYTYSTDFPVPGGTPKPFNDADIVVFNPDRIIDRGTFEDPVQAPEGIKYVLVNGAVTVDEGNLVDGAAAGVAIRAPLAAEN